MAHQDKHDPGLTREARELFVQLTGQFMPEVAKAVLDHLSALVDQIGNAREMQERRDAWIAFQKSGNAWVAATIQSWHRAVSPPTATTRVRLETLNFELLGDEVVETKIIASRLGLSLMDRISWELNDLRQRVQSVEGTTELASHDILRPEVLAQLMIEQWSAAGLPREVWGIAYDVIRKQFMDHMVDIYHAVNQMLIERGVMPFVDLRPKLKRSEEPPQPKPVVNLLDDDEPSPPARGKGGRQGSGGKGGKGGGDGARGGSGSQAVYLYGNGREPGMATRAHDETRMQTSTSPLARARQRAQGVIGQLRRMLGDRVAGYDAAPTQQASPALMQAMAQTEAMDYDGDYAQDAVVDAGSVQRVAGTLRARTQQLKQKASSQGEKATIEIVALMFQSILAEERIPAAVRVWFARLQMPVLRVALAEPDFFESLTHPARQLIDRMGSCVLGFDSVAIAGGALEGEIRRVVQVIEQYPETGRRVFELVYDEFQKFLSRFLTEQGGANKVVSIAQQVEQKETIAIQYTIELRNLLADVPVADAIREFLFKVWAEVLAVAAMKHGTKHAETVTLKQTAADLVWAASAKPNRNDRARVIQDLPSLLQRLRGGMSLLGLATAVQEQHIKTVSDTLADAFMSRTGAIAQTRIDAMAKRLANLEEYFSDDEVGDLPLDSESIEMMIGIDASNITVIADGGSQPSEAMLAWARELQEGHWFRLDHNGRISQVQFAWRSQRGQLSLFAATDGRNFLVQSRRLAAYLQAGLLTPIEEEALTVRATRDALAKLDANPERLLN